MEDPLNRPASTAVPAREARPERPVNHSLGLTLYCWMRLAGRGTAGGACIMIVRGFASVASACSTAVASDRRRARRLQDHRLGRRPPARCRQPGAAQRSRMARRGARRSARVTAPIRAIPTAAIRYAQALRATGQRAQAAAVLETAALHNPEQQGAARRLWPRARRCRQASSRRSRCSSARTRPTSRTGASSRCRARCSTRWAATRRRSAITRARCRIMPDEPSVLSNLGLSYALSKDLQAAEETLRARVRRAAAPTSACGRTSRWWSACRAASRKPRRSRAPTCRRTRPPRMSPICARCWRRRAAPHANLKKTIRPRAVEGLDPVEEGGS